MAASCRAGFGTPLVSDINASGEIAGHCLTGDGTGLHGFIAIPDGGAMPRPASLALIRAGVAGLPALRWHGGGHANLA